MEPENKPALSNILFKLATPDIYRNNAFCILDLPITASLKEINSAAQKFDLNEKYGIINKADNNFPLKVNRDKLARHEAVQRLLDPELRFIDEFFWFWPLLSDSTRNGDNVITSTQQNKITQAISTWKKNETNNIESNISSHNLAIYYHASALDMEITGNGEKNLLQEKFYPQRFYWEQAFSRWKALLEDESYWRLIFERIRKLEDPRITSDTVRQLREALPKTLLLVNSTLAVKASEISDILNMTFHLEIMKESGFEAKLIQDAIHYSLIPTRERIKTLCFYAKDMIINKPTKDQEPASNLMNLAYPLLNTIDKILPNGDSIRVYAHDEVAAQARSVITTYVNETKEWQNSLKLYSQALEIAASYSIQQKITEDIDIINKNIEYVTRMVWGKSPTAANSKADVKTENPHSDKQTDKNERTTPTDTVCSRCLKYNNIVTCPHKNQPTITLNNGRSFRSNDFCDNFAGLIQSNQKDSHLTVGQKYRILAVGIDFGTNKSVIAILRDGVPKVVINSGGKTSIPSYVAMSKSSLLLVGESAKRQAIVNPENTIYNFKTFVGRGSGEKLACQSSLDVDIKTRPYKAKLDKNNNVKIIMGGAEYDPQEIAALIIRKLKQEAEIVLGEKVTDAVITVPAYFADSQRQATKYACTIAGFSIINIISEPIAAALAYGIDKKKNETIAVYNMSANTFDISILDTSDGIFHIKSSVVDFHLGGDNFDQKIVDWLCDEFKRDQGIDLTKDRMALQRLKEAAEKVKIELSTIRQTDINLPFITADANGPKFINITLNRTQLEYMVMVLVEKTVELCKQALVDAGKTNVPIDKIIFVGGQTRMPIIQQKVKQLFNQDSNKSINHDEVMAIGAAIQAGILMSENKDELLLDAIPLTLSIKNSKGLCVPIFRRNTPIPVSKSFVWTTSIDNQSSIEIHIVQGERLVAIDNHLVAIFSLSGIKPLPRGLPQFLVTFDVDANGILNVKAIDKVTGRELKLTINAFKGLSKKEIENIRKEYEVHAAGDETRRRATETNNNSDDVA